MNNEAFYTADELAGNVCQWGYDKGILKEEYLDMQDDTARWAELFDIREAQALKTQEEVQELGQAILNDDREEAMDAIGDIIVTLIMQAELWDTDIFECLQGAYEVINQRTGKMVDNQFVKDK